MNKNIFVPSVILEHTKNIIWKCIKRISMELHKEVLRRY